MKRIITIVIAVIMVLSFTVPAMAADVTTQVTVSSGGGAIPVVKAKWEQEPIATLESGDPTHLTPGSQFLPPLVQGAIKPITYCAVVTDAEEMGDVYEVYALVYHPLGSPAPYNASDPWFGEYFKYKVVFTKVGHGADAISQVLTAYNAGLITFNPDFDISEITNASGTGELDKGTADLWCGEGIIDYEQPAGEYRVNVAAIDHNNNRSDFLNNTFLYIPTCGVEVDFTGVVYGAVNLGIEKMVAGDRTWNTPFALAPTPNPATVRNIGNTWAHVTINQSDMLFSRHGIGPATTYQGAVPPNGLSNWNVTFDARMGNSDTYKRYFDPFVTVILPNYLGLSKLEELDFSINVQEGFGTHNGTMTIGCTIEPFAPVPPATPGGV